MPARHTLRADLATVAEIWVDAFTGDPFLRWIQPDDRRWPEFGTNWMSFIAELAFERGHTYLADGNDVAVAWIPPDLSLVGPDDLTRGKSIIAAAAGERRAEEAFTTIVAARGHALDEPHWTLQYLGVRPSAQGSGIGSRVVSAMLQTVDAEGLPCGLVSSNPRNVSFYERLGFAVATEVSTPDGAVRLRPMQRQASTS